MLWPAFTLAFFAFLRSSEFTTPSTSHFTFHLWIFFASLCQSLDNVWKCSSALQTNFGESSQIFGKWLEIFRKPPKTLNIMYIVLWDLYAHTIKKNYMVTCRHDISLRVEKYFTHSWNIFQQLKKNFVSSCSHVISPISTQAVKRKLTFLISSSKAFCRYLYLAITWLITCAIKKTPMNKRKHTKRDALHSAYELVCVAQNQLQYLLKVRQATCGCKLKQQEKKSSSWFPSQKQHHLVFPSDRVWVRIIFRVVRELTTYSSKNGKAQSQVGL